MATAPSRSDCRNNHGRTSQLHANGKDKRFLHVTETGGVLRELLHQLSQDKHFHSFPKDKRCTILSTDKKFNHLSPAHTMNYLATPRLCILEVAFSNDFFHATRPGNVSSHTGLHCFLTPKRAKRIPLDLLRFCSFLLSSLSCARC